MESLKGRDYLTVADWSREELLAVLDLADRLKDERKRYVDEPLLPGRSVGLLLEKPSLRTRVSFELAVYQLGGHAVHLTGLEVGLGLREATRDIAYVLSGYLDALMVRTFAQSLVEELAEHARIPVVNGLTDETHPCQALADAMTIRERLGGFDGVRVAWLGDGNNVCVSLCADVRRARDGVRGRVARGLRARRAMRAAPRPARGGARRERPRHRRVDEHGPGGGGRAAACATSPATGSTATCSRWRLPTRSCCIACPPTSARRSPRRCCTGRSSAAWDEAENRLHSEKALLALIVE